MIITIEVAVQTSEAEGTFTIEGNGLSHCFEQLPLLAAEQGLALVNDGQPVRYSVKVVSRSI